MKTFNQSLEEILEKYFKIETNDRTGKIEYLPSNKTNAIQAIHKLIEGYLPKERRGKFKYWEGETNENMELKTSIEPLDKIWNACRHEFLENIKEGR